jgi:hypothetical protein
VSVKFRKPEDRTDVLLQEARDTDFRNMCSAQQHFSPKVGISPLINVIRAEMGRLSDQEINWDEVADVYEFLRDELRGFELLPVSKTPS